MMEIILGVGGLAMGWILLKYVEMVDEHKRTMREAEDEK